MEPQTPDVATVPSPALDYQPGGPVRRRRRVALLLAVASLAVLCVWQGPASYRRAVRSYWARQVANYRAPADRVVYEEDPARWPALLAQGGYRNMLSSSPGWCSYVAYMAEPVQRLAEAGSLRLGGTAVFAHARRTPSGKQRVVVVWLPYNAVRCDANGATPDNQVNMTFFTSVWDGAKLHEDRAAPWLAPDRIARDRTTPLYARMMAGQPDPNDPAHFTIPFEMGEYSDVIDGYLREDDSVVLLPRNHEHMLNPNVGRRTRRRGRARRRGRRAEPRGAAVDAAVLLRRLGGRRRATSARRRSTSASG